MLTLSGFLYFWGLVFLVTTTIVGLLKKEDEPRSAETTKPDRDIKQAYISLKYILSLKPVQTLVVILLTCKVSQTFKFP